MDFNNQFETFQAHMKYTVKDEENMSREMECMEQQYSETLFEDEPLYRDTQQ